MRLYGARLGALLALLLSSASYGQQFIQQNGGITPGHDVVWVTDGVVGDGGSSGGGLPPFAPSPAFATLSVTATSNSVTLPNGSQVMAQNTGSSAVSCTIDVDTATATTNMNIIQGGSSFVFTVGPNNTIACIDQTDTATNTIVLSGGAGFANGLGGGGSGGGGGGSVTQGTVPWADNISQWGGVAVGVMANYGTSPGAVKAPGVNAFVTNTITVTGAGGTFPVTQSTSPWIIAGGGTAGTAASGVVTVQGIASMTPLLASGTGTAGTAATGVVTVQGISSMTPVQVAQGTASSLNATVSQATGTNLHIVCDSGCSSSTAPADESAFTFGTTSQTPIGGVYQTTATNNPLTTGQMGAFQVTANRALFTNLRNSSGTEIGTSSSEVFVGGRGSAGTPAGGILTIQGVSSMTKLLVTPDLPSGASTAALQSGVQTPVNPNTATATNGNLLGGQYDSTQKTLTNGQQAGYSMSSRGGMIVSVGAEGFSVTANAGTNLNTSALALESGGNLAQIAGAVVSQGTALGSTKNILDSGSVTTAAPTYTTGQINPLSLTTAGGLRVDLKDTAANTNNLNVNLAASAATVTVSATNLSTNLAQVNGVTVSTGTGAVGTGTARVAVGTDTATIAGSAPGTAGTASAQVVTIQGIASMTKLLVTPDANSSVNVAQINGSTTVTAATGVQKVGVVGNAGAIFDGATGAAVPANVIYAGLSDGTNLRGWLNAANSLNSTGAGIGTAQIVGQFDDVAPTSITENQFGNIRMSANRNVYQTIRDAAGNERGANVNANSALLTAIDQTTVGTTNGVSIAQLGATTVSTGNGMSGTGVLRVSIASDSTGIVQNVPGTASGLTTFFLQPAASDNHTNIKNGAGQVYHVAVTNNSATINYLRFYNAATGFNGCNSATNLVYQLAIPASTTGAGFVQDISAGLVFATGISICVTSAYATTDTTNATASAMSLLIGYK